jgi:nucleoid DNA-binding protein
MTKKEFAQKLAERLDTTNANASRSIDAVFDILEETLEANDTYSHQGFGTFKTKKQDAATRRNPATGETMECPAKYVPKFSYSPKVKTAVANITVE